MIRKLLVRTGVRLAEAWANNRYPLAAALGSLPGVDSSAQRQSQLLLMNQWRDLAARRAPLPSFDDAQFRVFSQNGEDGILLLLFALVGVTNRRVVEMCCGTGIDCNAANLLVHHGWEGLLFDGKARHLALGRRFYARCADTRQWPPTIAQAWITAENVNDLLRQHGYTGEIDLFSLDLDGVDYWIWKALDVVRPRVVVLEYQDILGPDRCVTVPYDPQFAAVRGPHGPDFAGASLGAYIKLGREKGYRLVGCERLGYNAFFLRDDVGADFFPEVDAASCFRHPRTSFGQRERWPAVADRPWQEV